MRERWHFHCDHLPDVRKVILGLFTCVSASFLSFGNDFLEIFPFELTKQKKIGFKAA